MHAAYEIVQAFAKYLKVSAPTLQLEQLKGGLSQTFLGKFSIDSRDYVLRLFKPELALIDRLRQMHNAIAAAKAGIAPKVCFIASNHEGYVMEYIHGRTVRHSDWQDVSMLADLANMIRCLHEAPFAFAEARSPFHAFHRSFTKGRLNGTSYPKLLFELNDRLFELEGMLQLHAVPRVPSHLDLNTQNILLEQDAFKLIDWEVGGLQDPCFDLSMLPLFLRLNSHQEEAFLKHYFERCPTDLERARIKIAQPISLALRGTIFLTIGTTDKTAEFLDAELASDRIPDFNLLMQGHETASLSFPRWKIGLSMLKHAAEILESELFTSSLSLCHKKSSLLLSGQMS